MKTLIAVLNSKYIHSSLAPWCLLAGIKEYSPETECVVSEGTINEKIDDVADRITAEKPDIIGFSCYIWNIEKTYELIKLVKKTLPDSVIILGGPEVSYNAAEVLENPLIDYVISGEGEKPFALLCKAIADNISADSIAGVCRKGHISAPYTPDEIPPSPYTEEYFAALGGRIAYLETSRGCPYSCAFCLSGRCGNARFYPLSRAFDEMLRLASSGTKTIKLVDRTFNANKERAKEIIRFIKANYDEKIPRGVCFHFEIAGDILDDETIELLNSMPVHSVQLEIGMQSFNEKTLAYINRKTNTEKLCRNIKRLTAAGNIHIHIDLIAGLPYEDIISFADSFNKAYSLNSNMLQLGFLKLLHGADMREDEKKYPCIYSKTPPYEVISTPWLSASEMDYLRKIEDCTDRIYNSERFKRTLNYALSESGKTPFELFSYLGEKSPDTSGISLDDYTAFIYSTLSEITDKKKLRDIMVCDRLAAISTGNMPPCLHIAEPKIKAVRSMLNANPETAEKPNIRRGIAWLYTENRAVYADYDNKNMISGEYKLHFAELK